MATEEEPVEGLSSNAHRRVSTTTTRQASRAGAPVQMVAVDTRELARAQAADGAGPPRRPGAESDPHGAAGGSR